MLLVRHGDIRDAEGSAFVGFERRPRGRRVSTSRRACIERRDKDGLDAAIDLDVRGNAPVVRADVREGQIRWLAVAKYQRRARRWRNRYYRDRAAWRRWHWSNRFARGGRQRRGCRQRAVRSVARPRAQRDHQSGHQVFSRSHGRL